MTVTSLQRRRPEIGILEWLRPGEFERARALLRDLQKLGIRHLRVGLSWADWHTEEGKKWFDWLIPTLAKHLELLPCFTYTPPSLGIEAKTSSPPRNPKWYADFIDVMIEDYGEYFEWIELWNEPNNLNDWDWHLDPQWQIFCEMMSMAGHWVKQKGKKAVLAGMCPTDPNWLDLIGSRGVLTYFDAVGIHGFPGTWEFNSQSWDTKVAQVRDVLNKYDSEADIWITEVGYSTWRHDELIQIRKFIEVLDAPVDRIYWYCANDLHPYESHQDGFHEDERHYHFGFKTADGNPKLLFRIWRDDGIEGLKRLNESVFSSRAGLTRNPLKQTSERISAHFRTSLQKPILITGGAGFVGTNLAAHLLAQGKNVIIFDNLSRPGVERNIEWLCDKFGNRLKLEIADIRDSHLICNAVHNASKIFHFAAQVAVTTSLENPRHDFEVNFQGTLNVLEAMRSAVKPPPLVFTSTNKVYGALGNLNVARKDNRYQPTDPAHINGVNERQLLDFHSPYGCSKGAADQYVLDYARSFNLPAIVFRMSCIYGAHQFGTEDQGWVAHFLIQALQQKPITLYGDGYQVRDILYVTDLVRALIVAQNHMQELSGRAFNIGGGIENAISLRELLQRIEDITGVACEHSFADWRQGDQKYYVSDTSSFNKLTGWKADVTIEEGLHRLIAWLHDQPWMAEHFARSLRPAAASLKKVKSEVLNAGI